MKKLMIALAACAAVLVGSAETRVVTVATDTFPEAPAGSLRAVLAEAQDGDTITFDDSLKGQTITIVGVNTAKADTSLVIDKTITIDGNDVIIDGGWDEVVKSEAGGRIFLVSSGLTKVTFKNLTLQHGHGRGWNGGSGWSFSNQYFASGAVCALSPVRFENCQFFNNCASDEQTHATSNRDGGAIRAAADLELVNCVFGGNRGGNGNSMYGGAISMENGSFFAQNIVATNNVAGSFGGGFFFGDSLPSFTLIDATIDGAHSSHTAGAIWLNSFTSARIERTRFANCYAPYGAGQGGAIRFGDGTCGRAVVRDCEFTDCTGQCGGAIRTHANPLVVVNTTFTGSAIQGDAWGPAVDVRNNTYFVNCTFTGNMFTDNNHGNDGKGGWAECRYSGNAYFLNTVGAYNYNHAAESLGDAVELQTGKDFYTDSTTFYNTIRNGKMSDGSTDLVPASLFASTYERSSINAWGSEVELKSGFVVPALSALGDYPSRVVEIAANGPLDGTGYPVKINEDYTWIQYSDDGGTAWKDLYKVTSPAPTTAPVLLAADQRGIEYSNGAPIGAAVVTPNPAVPYFKSPTAAATDTGAKITLNGITVGTDATTYDVYVYEGDNAAAAVKVAEGQTGATVTFALDGLSLGAHTYSVYLKNDRQVQSETKTVSVLFEGPVTDNPNGSWVVTKLTADGNECVVTDGKLLYAYAGNNRSKIINDVMFKGSSKLADATDNIEVVPEYSADKSDYNNNDSTAGALPSSDWKTLLGDGWLMSSDSQVTSTFSIKGLTKGAAYKVQLLVHNGNNKENPARSIFPPWMHGVEGYEGFYGRSSAGEHTDWDLGSSLVGRFVATGAVHQLTFTYSPKACGWKCLNAIQVRELRGPQPEPETPYEVTGEHKTIIDGDYVVFVWKNPSEAATIKIPSDVKADYLVVGGGGAGGFCRGGGGGGGGVVYQTMQDFVAGTYTITVGAGGTPDTWPDHYSTSSNDPYKYSGSTTADADGGRSALMIGDTVVGEALGGGGGGTFITGQSSEYSEYGSSGAGRTGANAGGSANKAGSTAALDASGFAGGAAYSAKDSSSGGGGGAGAAGFSATAEKVAGNGGDGVLCSIIGSEAYYGGGGGGGVYDGTAGIGGLGGGGRGGDQGNGGRNSGMLSGLDGFGGGGGGASGAGNKWVATVGAPGGSGTVIIRLPLDPSSQTVPPSFKLATPTVDGRAATIKLNNIVLGTDSTGEAAATSYDVYAYTGDDPAAAVKRGENLSAATAEFSLTGLEPNDYTYNVYIVNNGGLQSKTLSATFTILPAVTPSATLATTVRGTDVTFGFSDIVIGTDAESHPAETYSILLAYAPQGDELPELQVVLADQTAATWENTVLDLDGETTYAYQAIISNNLGSVSAPITGTFTTGVYVETVDKLARKLGAGEWVGVPMTGQPSDVVSYGEEVLGSDGKVRAYINGNLGTDATISFVNFRDGWNTSDLNMVFGSGHKDYGDAGTTGCYVGLMKWGWYGNNSGDDTYTLKNLVPGQSYLLQIFVHDGRGGAINNRNFGPGPGNTGNRIYFGEDTKDTAYTERGGVNWYYGGTLIHAFVATGTDYTFVINTASGSQQINAIQLRSIPMPKGSPKIGAVTTAIEQGTAMVTLGGVAMGTDDDAQPATSYDVYAAIDDADPVKVLAGQEEAPVSFFVQQLAVGEHDIKVFIENNFGVVSPTNSVAVTVVTADPAYYFAEGSWGGVQLSKDAHEIRTFGETVYALATSAGNNGRLYTVNGLKYHDTQRNNVSWGDWQLVNWADFEPALNSDKDSFGGEDVPTISNEDMAFQTVCKRGWLAEYYARTTPEFTMTLKQLEPGVRYVVQLTAHNGSDSYGGKGQTMTAPDGVSTITLGDADATGACRYGGTLIGTFVASNTTHAFKFTYGSDPRFFQLNSIQLRKTSEAPAVAPAYPTLGNTSVFVGRGSASLTVSGLNAGVADGACDIYYALAEEGQAFGAYTLGAQNVSDASCTFALTGIERGKTYIYSVYAVNPATRLASLKADGRFAVSSNPGIPDEMTVEPLIRPGLVQAKFGEKVLFESNAQPPLVSNLLTQTDYVGSLDFTYGALMANQNCADASVKVVNTYTAAQWNWDTSYTVFAYEGEIYLQKGQRLVIFGMFDDGTAAVVDGVTLFAQGDQSGFNKTPAIYNVIYDVAETGWYPLNAWVWDWSSGKNCMTPPSSLAYNFSGITTINDQNRSQWKHLEDTDGKGSFLRFKDPSKTLMTLGVPATNGVDVTINAAFTGVPGAAKFVAYVSSANDGELDPLAWDEVVKIADIPAGDTAAADYTVKGLASYPFVRFAIEGEGSVSTAERCRNFRQMSRVVGFDSEGLSILIASPVFTKNSGTFNVSVASLGDATSLGLNVEVSSDPVFGTAAYQGTIDGITHPGSFPVEVEGLTPGTTYYIRVKPTSAGDDAWVISAPVETAEAGTVRINEIMASNGDTFKTKKGRSGLDWIEIYNGTDEVVDLSGWYLYDDPAKAQSKWKKVQGTCVIPVHGYGIVWCDKDYTDWDAANEAWSEIGLSTSGETVFLAKPDGTVVDTVTFGTQMKDISYGVGKLPGSDEVTHVFFKVTTPGAENGEYGYGPMTPSVAFTVPHGYKTEAIDVAITCEADPNAEIYYTLDGTQPTTASTKYTTPIHIDSTTILRAGVPQENTVLQVDSSATYIYLDDVLSMDRVETGAGVPAGFPESSAKHTMRYGMVQSVVNGADHERILRGFTNTVATLSIVIDPDCLFNDTDGIYVNSRKYMNDGAAGERPMLLEQIDPVHGAANEFSVPGGLRLRGSSSLAQSNPKHSLRFFFRGQYGMSKLEFPLFGEEGADSFSKVDLRCSQNYSWSMNNSEYDTFVHELFSRDSQRDLGQPYTRTRYYNLFINGQYWGLYMTQERGDKDFGETYLGGNEDYYDCIKTSSQDQWHYVTTANDGTLAAWRNLQGLAYNGFAGDYVDNYNRALGLNPDGSRNEAYPILLNPENLMAYVTIAHFVCDADGPVSVGNGGLNNLYANRYQIDGGSSMDGFWFLRHDAEHSLGVKGEGEPFGTWTQYGVDNTGLGTHEYNPLNPDWSNTYRGEAPTKDDRSTGYFGPYELHAQLAKNPVYRRAFADYFYKHYLKEGGAMTPAVAKQRFQARMAEIDDVVVSEAARWSPNANQPKSRETWLAACQSCLDFIDARTPVLKAAYQARGWYPSIDAPVSDVTDGEGSLGQVVTFTAVDGAEIYVTTDGSDPAESGTLSASATVTALPCTIKARAKLNDEWSPAQEVELIAPKLTGDGLIITIAGNYTSTQELAPTGDVCRVILEDAEVPGGLILKPGVAYTFEPAAETVNTIGKIIGGDTSTFVLNGEGTLSMTGADTLLTVNDLIVSNGTFAIKSTGVSVKKTPIVKVMGNLFQTGGKIDIDVSVDSAVQVYGIMLASKKMEAEFSGGELVAKVGGQNKSAAIVTDKGSSDIVFKKECKITAELSGVDSRLAFSAGEIKFAKTLIGPVVVTMPQDLTGVSEAHVFKAEKTIEINGGTFDINVPATGSEIFSASRPDEAADEDPGIIVIKGGTFELVADDDCFNATDFIDVRDGLFYAVSLSDDVFDSNGGMDISGGTILAYTAGAGHEAFDVEPEATPMTYPSTNEHVLAISGGTIFATGGKSSAWPTTITTAEGVNLFSFANADVSAYSGKYLTLNSSPKVTAKLPVFPASTGSVLATCPGFDGTNVSTSDTAPKSGSQNFHDLYITTSGGFLLIVR